jgi:hypothetical protein
VYEYLGLWQFPNISGTVSKSQSQDLFLFLLYEIHVIYIKIFLQREFYYSRENKCEQSIAEYGEFDYTWLDSDAVVAHEKEQQYLESHRRFSFCVNSSICFIQHIVLTV